MPDVVIVSWPGLATPQAVSPWRDREPVAVVVGGNNSGKTSLLRALRFLFDGVVPSGMPTDVTLDVRGKLASGVDIRRLRPASSEGGKPNNPCLLAKVKSDVSGLQTGRDISVKVTADVKLLARANGLEPDDMPGAELKKRLSQLSADEQCWLHVSALPNQWPTLLLSDATAPLDPTPLLTNLVKENLPASAQKLLEEAEAVFSAEGQQTLAPLLECLRGQLAVSDVQINASWKLKATPEADMLRLDGLPLASHGTGIAQKAALGITQWLAQRAVLPQARQAALAYDEPDRHLDFSAQREFAEQIRHAGASGVPIVITTHSPLLMDQFPPVDLFHMRRGCVRPLLSDQTDAGQFETVLGTRVSRLFTDRAFLLVEGPSEVAVLPVVWQMLFDRTPAQDGVCIKSVNGCGDLAAAHRHLAGLGRPIAVVADSDVCTHDDFQKISNLRPTLLGRVELEDLFSAEAWMSCLRRHSEGQLADVEAALGAAKPSEALAAVLGFRSKPRMNKVLADHLQSTDDRSLIPARLAEQLTGVRAALLDA